MSFSFMRLFTGDYIKDTRGMSPMAHGIYLLFLIYQWDTRGPIPPDEQDAAGIANCRSQDEIEAMRRVLSRFFISAEDGFYNPRMLREIQASDAIAKRRSDAGISGARSRVNKLKQNKIRANAEQMLNKCLASAEHLPLASASASASASALDLKVKNTMSTSAAPKIDDAVLILEFLNTQTGRAYRPTANTLKPIRARLKEGFSVAECKAVILRRKREWSGDDKMRKFLRPLTLFGAEKFAQYIGDVAPQQETDDA